MSAYVPTEMTGVSRLRVIIEDKGMTHRELARRLGIAPSTFSDYLNGTRKGRTTRRRIAEALEVKVSSLWPEEPEPLAPIDHDKPLDLSKPPLSPSGNGISSRSPDPLRCRFLDCGAGKTCLIWAVKSPERCHCQPACLDFTKAGGTEGLRRLFEGLDAYGGFVYRLKTLTENDTLAPEVLRWLEKLRNTLPWYDPECAPEILNRARLTQAFAGLLTALNGGLGRHLAEKALEEFCEAETEG
jgi:transcriptional regulator with XRE-family HTH domain